MRYSLTELELRDLGLNQIQRDVYAAAIVAAGGAAFLDVKRPGWHDCIDIDRLHTDSTGDDILGQLYSDYMIGLEVLDICGDAVDQLGFIATLATTRSLDAAWKTEILRRKRPSFL